VCVVLNAPNGNRTWRMRRSVEMLSFHQAKKHVRVLLGFFLKNCAPDNFLGVMHQGEVDLYVHPAWPLPHHPNEDDAERGILEELYGGLFSEAAAKSSRSDTVLHQQSTLTAWDKLVRVEQPQTLHAWRPFDGLVQRLEPEPRPSESYVPFTTWRLGPFKELTSYLITVELRIGGETYKRLVERETQFTVDGPERLLSTFRYMELPRVPQRQRAAWSERLAAFENQKLLLGEGYDIIVLRPPFGDAVEFLRGGLGIAPAGLQPSNNTGLRFTTVDQAFSIGLRYANADVESPDAEIVAYR